jgi:hypothetical protein
LHHGAAIVVVGWSQWAGLEFLRHVSREAVGIPVVSLFGVDHGGKALDLAKASGCPFMFSCTQDVNALPRTVIDALGGDAAVALENAS